MNKENLHQWLLNSPNWMGLRLKNSKLFKKEDFEQESLVRKKTISDPQVNILLDKLLDIPYPVLKRHNDSSHWIHILCFLADIGLTYLDDQRITLALDKVLLNLSDEGFPQVLINIPTHFGGTGEDEMAWLLCDSPLLVYALNKMNAPNSVNLLNLMIKKINLLITDSGIPCSGSPKIGSFRGPGKKSDPCPYVNLLYLKLLTLDTVSTQNSNDQIVQQSLLELWKNRFEKKQYLFAMGSGFEKLKAPLIWFDILHVAEVLSNFSESRNDKRFQTMTEILFSKKNNDGLYQAESIWRPWTDWDFGQKKNPSYWITFLVNEIEDRLNA